MISIGESLKRNETQASTLTAIYLWADMHANGIAQRHKNTHLHETFWLWSREQCSALHSARSPSFTFSLAVFYLRFHPSFSPIGPRTRAAELSLYRLQLDTHIVICIHTSTHTHTHTQHFMHCLRLIFLSHLFESRPLRVHTNADLETQKIRHLNSDWREMYPPSEETLWRSDSILF